MVIGQGRSGTSLLSSVLRELGYKIPQPEIPADETNPRGFGEPAWLVDFHKKLLKKCMVENSDARPSAFASTLDLVARNEQYRSMARTWLEDQFADAGFVLLKDPRQLWFTTFWEDVALELGIDVAYVTTLRAPCEVVASKQHWYDLNASATNSTAGWINTMLYAERATRDRSRGFVAFSTLVSDWVSAVGQLDAQASLPPVRRAPTRFYRKADALVDPSLHRTTGTWADLGVPALLTDLADRVWRQLSELADPEGTSLRFDAEFDALRSEYRELYEWTEAVAQSTATAARRAGLREGRRLERLKRAGAIEAEQGR